MYTPSQFEESRPSALHSLIRAHPLATLVARTSEGISADHIPLLLLDSVGTKGMLQGHVARANPMREEVPTDGEILAIFQGPNRYISPKWYPSKQQHGRVVPTWNYLVVHARGKIRWKDDPAWLRKHLEDTTERHEGTSEPWRLSDAPPDFLERMLSAIAGFEIPIADLRGKWKLSQNRSIEDRMGVIAGLQSQSDSRAAEMVEWIRDDGGPA